MVTVPFGFLVTRPVKLRKVIDFGLRCRVEMRLRLRFSFLAITILQK